MIIFHKNKFGVRQKFYIKYSGSKLIVEYSTKLPDQPSTNYTTTDHLGKPRVITDQFGVMKSRRDMMSFGEEITTNVDGRTGDKQTLFQ